MGYDFNNKWKVDYTLQRNIYYKHYIAVKVINIENKIIYKFIYNDARAYLTGDFFYPK